MSPGLNDLPHEIVLRIVEWTALIIRDDKLRERQSTRANANQNNPGPPEDGIHNDGATAGGGQGGPPAQLQPPNGAGIGDNGFMQNLMGFFNVGATAPQPTNTGGNAAAAASAAQDAIFDDLPPLEPVGEIGGSEPSLPSANISSSTATNATATASTSSPSGDISTSASQPAPLNLEQQDTLMNNATVVVTDDDDEWEDEEGEGESDEDDEDENMYDSEAVLTDEEDDDDSSEVDSSTFTYPDGLPSCPYLPLAFINRSFLNAARTLLYGRHIHIGDIYQAHLLLRTLQGPIVNVHPTEPDADDDETRFRRTLAYLIRDIRIEPSQCVSLGRGGGSILVDLVSICPRLQHVYCGVTWTKSALPKFIKALAGCTGMKNFAMRGPDEQMPGEAALDLGVIEPLLSTWKELEDLQLVYLDSAPGKAAHQLKPIAGKLTKITLAHPDITDDELMYLLSTSKGRLDTLEIHRPTSVMTRKGLAKAIVKYGSSIANLQIDVGPNWHRMTPGMALAQFSTLTASQAASTRWLMDGLIGYLPKVVELKLSGSLASVVLLARAPKTIVVLALEDSVGIELPKAISLLKKGLHLKKSQSPSKTQPKTKPTPTVLPKLRCLTLARSDGALPSEEAMQEMTRIMDARQACIHWSYTGSGAPAAVWEGFPGPMDDLPPAGALAMLGGMLGLPMDGALPPLPPFIL